MLLNNFLIEENPPGPEDIKISAEVIIKRDGKHYAVKIRRGYNYSNGADIVEAMKQFHDLIMQFYMDCQQIDKFHIPIPKGQFKDAYHKELYDEVFILN